MINVRLQMAHSCTGWVDALFEVATIKRGIKQRSLLSG